jgi:GTP-binding protein HflX
LTRPPREDDSSDPPGIPAVPRRPRGEPIPLRKVELAVLAHVAQPDDLVPADEALDELAGLAASAGATVVGRLLQNRRHADRATYLGRGRVDELKALCTQVGAALVIFGDDLSPAQGVNLEKILGLRVIDRSQLIMDLFAARARTHQARLQVELAQLEYSLPRLKRMWTHLDRYKGGIGMRGPGETQLELDRREIEKKINDRRRRIRGIELQHETQRASRESRFTVGLVGYTNAGKSTLFNRLTGGDAAAENRPFTTLDTKTSPWKVDRGCSVLLSDTIGFIRNLPHHLIASFHATLQEALAADLLLHVVDGARPDALQLVEAVDSVLAQTRAAGRPRRLVVNKVDGVAERGDLARFGVHALHVSARSGEGIAQLAEFVAAAARAGHVELRLRLPHREGALLTAIEASALVLERTVGDEATLLRALVPPTLAGRVRAFVVAGDPA